EYDRSVHALGEIGDMSREAGIECLVFLLPATWGSFDLQRPLHGIAAGAAQSGHLPAFSLLDSFAAAGKSPAQYQVNVIDGHPNASYHAVATAAILEQLRRAGALDKLARSSVRTGS